MTMVAYELRRKSCKANNLGKCRLEISQARSNWHVLCTSYSNDSGFDCMIVDPTFRKASCISQRFYFTMIVLHVVYMIIQSSQRVDPEPFV